jgi:cytochrome P450
MVIYQLYFHPLAVFPDPKFNAISKIPYLYSLVRGYQAQDTQALHDQYGETVRIVPNKFSFTQSEARKEMFGYGKGQKHFMKDPLQYIEPPNGVWSIYSALDDANHARQRRFLAHAFSEKALREQEPLLRSYVDSSLAGCKNKLKVQLEGNSTWFDGSTIPVLT